MCFNVIGRPILKFIWKSRALKIAKIILQEMNKVGRVTLLLLVFFCHVTNYKRKLKTKTVWYLTDLYIRVHGGFFCSMSHKDEIKESAIFVLH